MHGPDGTTYPNESHFVEIVPEERIVFTTALTAGWRPAATALPITAIISMTDENNITNYATQVLIKNKADRQKLQEMNFEAGWTLGIEQLSEFALQLM